MELHLRLESESEGYKIADIDPREVESVLNMLKRSGGVYVVRQGLFSRDLSYQFVIDDFGARAEIVVGE